MKTSLIAKNILTVFLLSIFLSPIYAADDKKTFTLGINNYMDSFEFCWKVHHNIEEWAAKYGIKTVYAEAEMEPERVKANLDTFFKSGQLPKKIPKPNIVIIDPPRAGMHPDMVKYLPKLNAEKIVYVSCNPTTQARDIVQLVKSGWKLKSMTLVDMFPHTPHIETVALLKK